MPPPFLRVNGFTRADRNHVIAALRDAVTQSGGWITDFKLFSNVSICINFEIPFKRLGDFHSSLKAIDLRLSEESAATLVAYSGGQGRDGARAAPADVVGTLQVTFIHDEPDLRVEVPPIPG